MNFRAAFSPLAAVFCAAATSAIAAEPNPAELGKTLAAVYSGWQAALAHKDYNAWQAATAANRQMEVRNRLISEKRPIPEAIFELPAGAPPLTGLKLINAEQKGATAKAAWFGKINFGVDGTPTDNVLVVSFINGGGVWRYDKADFVNLGGLPEVRKELAAGDLSYVKEAVDFRPSGTVPTVPAAVPSPKYIAKVYVFCPGRDVTVQVNQYSRHHFVNAQEAELVMGGVNDGINSISFLDKKIEGGKGNEALAVRVYLMPEVEGVQPIKAYEYRVEEGGEAKPSGGGSFYVDPAAAGKILPR